MNYIDDSEYLPLKTSNYQDLEIQESRVDTGTASFSDCTVNLIKSIIGSGMLAFPSAFVALGYIPGVTFTILCAYFASFGLKIYSSCAVRVGPIKGGSIRGICTAVSPRLVRIIDISVLFLCIGSAASYLVLIGDTMPAVCSSLFGFSGSRNLWILGLGCLVIGPLAFIRQVKRLKYTSIVGLFAIAYVLVLAIVFAADGFYGDEIKLVETDWHSSDLTVFIFAYSCHQNLLSIKEEAIDQSEKFTDRFIDSSIWISTAVYLAFSLASAFAFGSSVRGNIFSNYPTDSVVFNIGRGLYAIMAVASIPLLTHPARASLIHLLNGTVDEYIVTLITLATAIFISIFFSNLKQITGAIGSWIGVPISYILPFYLYWHLFPENRSYKSWATDTYKAVTICIFGIVLLIGSIFGK